MDPSQHPIPEAKMHRIAGGSAELQQRVVTGSRTYMGVNDKADVVSGDASKIENAVIILSAHQSERKNRDSL